ncbi:P-loop NTPase family protein [Kineococcus sp. SYSU DK002]|uniref:DUF1611 domain-containing protein n=1 Tax=Kineococcus sp. SYSU DK002 TaxID=3383123 RepID=UPI003D7F160B
MSTTSQHRIRTAKRAFTTRCVDLAGATGLTATATPRAGDLVLARVGGLGQHRRLECPRGRRQSLFVGDEVVVAYGHRYAPDQFEASVPGDLGPCHLVAAGGVAARVDAAHAAMAPATTLEPVGLLTGAAGRVLNLADHPDELLTAPAGGGGDPVVLAVTGAAMNSGKTTAAAALVRGLVAAGLRVGAAKVTGTGAGGDLWLLEDSGARPVLDFTSAGLPTTFRADAATVLRTFTGLLDAVAGQGVDVVVVEVADGVFQTETAGLLRTPEFARRVDGVLFAAPDALAAVAGLEWLRRNDLPVVALTGLVTASPLATREAEAATGHRSWGPARLSDPVQALTLLAGVLPGVQSGVLPGVPAQAGAPRASLAPLG